MLTKCIDCGKQFDGKHNQIRCPECQTKYRKRLLAYKNKCKQYIRKIEYDYFTCGHRDCRFAITSGLVMCDYMAIHMREHPNDKPHARPCKATPECSCYEKGRRKRIKYGGSIYGKRLSGD